MRFTDNYIKSLKPKADRYEVFAGHGVGAGAFGVRVSPKGKKTWIFLYRFRGRPRRMTLGVYPETTLAMAGTRLSRARELLEKGEDPGALAVAERKAERAAETVAELIEDYIAREVRKLRGAREVERVLRREVMPAWGRRKAKDIKRRDVIRLTNAIVDRGSPIMANRVHGWIRRMFAYAIEQDIVEANPVWGTKAPGGRERERQRVLDDAEIRTFWTKLDDTDMSGDVKVALKLILATGQRPGEVAGIALAEIDEDAKLWTIPGEKSKNGVAHVVPLHDLALDLIGEAKARATERVRKQDDPRGKFLFPSRCRTAKRPHLTEQALADAVRRNRAVFGMEDWTPHDLRRTARTFWSRLGISTEVAELLLNHRPGKLRRTYDTFDRLPEKRAAMRRWGATLKRIVEGRPEGSGTVVDLRSA